MMSNRFVLDVEDIKIVKGRRRRSLARRETQLHKVADKHRPRVEVAVRLAFALGRKAIGRSRDAEKAVKAMRASLEDTLPKVLRKVYAAGGEVAAGGMLRAAGDYEGHPFRGNQYTGSMASYSEDPSVPSGSRGKVRKAIALFEQTQHPHASKVHLFVAPKGKGHTDNPYGYTKRNIKIEGGKPVRDEQGNLVYTGKYSMYISSRRVSTEDIFGTVAHEFEHVSQWERGEEPHEAGAISASIAARRKLRAAEFDPDQPRDEQGRWTDTGGSGSESIALKSEHLRSVGDTITPRALVGGHFLKDDQKKAFRELGYTDEEYDQFRDRLDQHSKDAGQASADIDIAENIDADTRFGQWLRDRAEMEGYLLNRASENVDKWYAEQERNVRKDFEQEKRLGISLYDPDYDGTEEEFIQDRLFDARQERDYWKNPRVWRRGDADKDVLSTTTRSEGAKTGWIGDTGTEIEPTHSWKLSELRAKGYVPLAGFTSLYGYVGENEVLFVKTKRKLRFAKRGDEEKPKSKRIGPLAFTFDSASEQAIAWADRHAAELIDGITETSREAINNAIAEALEEGTDPYEAILDAVGDEDRAHLIAHHEVMMAVHEGQREAWRQATEEGLLTGAERPTWIVTGDDKVCPICEGLDGKTRDLDGQYVSDDGEFDGPPAHPRCRCTEGLT